MDDVRDDQALVRAAQRGDRSALEALLRRHADRIGSLCLRLTGNPADAADAAQEAMIAIVRRLDRFEGRSSFSTWAYRVTTNVCLDELRRRRRRPLPTDVILEPHQDEPTVADAVTDQVAIAASLARLPDEFRVPVVLRDVCALDYAEIAAALDVPLGTVKSRIARGRAALAGILGNPTSTDNRPTS